MKSSVIKLMDLIYLDTEKNHTFFQFPFMKGNQSPLYTASIEILHIVEYRNSPFYSIIQQVVFGKAHSIEN